MAISLDDVLGGGEIQPQKQGISLDDILGDAEQPQEQVKQEQPKGPKIGFPEGLRLGTQSRTGVDNSESSMGAIASAAEQATLGTAPLGQKVQELSLKDLAKGLKRTLFRGDVPFSEMRDFELTGAAIEAGIHMPFTDSALSYWDKNEGPKFKDDMKRKKARVEYVQGLAQEVLKDRLQKQQEARQQLETRDKTLGAKIGAGGLENVGYMSTYMLGAPAAIGVSAAGRFGDVTSDKLTVDEEGNIQMQAKGDGMAYGAVKAVAGGVAEYTIEKYLEKPLGWLGSKFAKAPVIREGLRVAAGTKAGKIAARTMDTFGRIGKYTGVQSLPVEVAEEWAQSMADNVVGFGLRADEAGKTFGEANSDFAKQVPDIIYSMLLIQGTQAGTAAANDYHQYAMESNRIDGTLKAFGATDESFQGKSLADKQNMYRVLEKQLTPEKANKMLRRLGNKAQDVYDTITQQEGWDFKAREEGVKPTFKLPDRGLAVGESYTDDASGISLLQSGPKTVSVINRDGNTVGEYSVAKAVEAANALSMRNQVQDGERGNKAEFIKRTAQRISGDLDVVAYNTMDEAIKANPDLAKTDDYDKSSPGFFKGGKIHVVLDNVRSPFDAVNTILHEGGVHAGLRNVLQGKGNLGQFLNNLSAPEVDGFKGFVAKNGYMSSDQVQAEEALAYMYENRIANPTGYQKAVSWLHDKIRGVNKNYAFTDSDIEVMMAAAHNSVTGNKGEFSRVMDIPAQNTSAVITTGQRIAALNEQDSMVTRKKPSIAQEEEIAPYTGVEPQAQEPAVDAPQSTAKPIAVTVTPKAPVPASAKPEPSKSMEDLATEKHGFTLRKRGKVDLYLDAHGKAYTVNRPATIKQVIDEDTVSILYHPDGGNKGMEVIENVPISRIVQTRQASGASNYHGQMNLLDPVVRKEAKAKLAEIKTLIDQTEELRIEGFEKAIEHEINGTVRGAKKGEYMRTRLNNLADILGVEDFDVTDYGQRADLLEPFKKWLTDNPKGLSGKRIVSEVKKSEPTQMDGGELRHSDLVHVDGEWFKVDRIDDTAFLEDGVIIPVEDGDTIEVNGVISDTDAGYAQAMAEYQKQERENRDAKRKANAAAASFNPSEFDAEMQKEETQAFEFETSTPEQIKAEAKKKADKDEIQRRLERVPTDNQTAAELDAPQLDLGGDAAPTDLFGEANVVKKEPKVSTTSEPVKETAKVEQNQETSIIYHEGFVGNAKAGDIIKNESGDFVVMGNFNKQGDANAFADRLRSSSAKLNPRVDGYLNGLYKRGWQVLQKTGSDEITLQLSKIAKGYSVEPQEKGGKPEKPSAPEQGGKTAAVDKTVFDSDYTGPRFTYGMKYRPLSIGAQPKGYIIDSYRDSDEFRHGKIQYPRQLTKEEVYDFELTPVEDVKPTASSQKKSLLENVKPPIDNVSDAKKARAAELIARMNKRAGRMNAGLDPESLIDGIELASIYIEGGVKTFSQFARSVKEASAELYEKIKDHLITIWTGAQAENPDIEELTRTQAKSVIAAIDEEAQKEYLNKQEEQDNVPSTPDSMEQDSPLTVPQDQVGESDVQPQPGRGPKSSGSGRTTLEIQGDLAQANFGLFDSPPAPSRKGSDTGVRAGNAGLGGGIPRSSKQVGSSNTNGKRLDDVAEGDRTTVGTSSEEYESVSESVARADQSIAGRIESQRKADAVPVNIGDRKNVKETLPLLFDGQHDDVSFAEERFSKEDGYGVMFTNGTGTGKTYTGVGVIKRLMRASKKNILIIAPNDNVIAGWQAAGQDLGMTINLIPDTQSSGTGVSITTYANLANNDKLSDRQWDLIVTDEAHNLMSNKNGEMTELTRNLRAISYHPEGIYTRMKMQHGALYARMNDARRARQTILEDTLREEWLQKETLMKSEFEAKQGKDRTRVMFLSATPFAYQSNIEYAEGYLFEYGTREEKQAVERYNQGSARERFFMQHFGMRMRTNKLTKADAGVDEDIMQRQFNEYLRKQGVLSRRMLDVEADYERKFATVNDLIGKKIDEGIDYLREGNGGRYRSIAEYVDKKFDYLSRMFLLEAIKATHAVPLIKEMLANGRKVVVFHDYNVGGGFNPFDLSMLERGARVVVGRDANGRQIYEDAGVLIDELLAERPDIFEMSFASLREPINVLRREFPKAQFINGTVPKKLRKQSVKWFNDDANGPTLLVVQSDAGREGISLHDVTGKYRRNILNLGLPIKPTSSIQQEGRIYRTGQHPESHAAFIYMNTGTNFERFTFAQKVFERSATAENLAMGNDARSLRQSFVEAFENADTYELSETEGRGGKQKDKAGQKELTDFEKAKTFYFSNQKRTSRNKSEEGQDYFATPEPLGQKMVEWLHLRPNEGVLEPSAGHGAISRWFPDFTRNTIIEPSTTLLSKAMLSVNARAEQKRFEEFDIGNKYMGIAMNPPFGTAGRTAVDHIAKAFDHLRDGGRIVAIMPEGSALDKFNKWYEDTPEANLVKVISLPSVVFNRAGTSVKTRVVIIDKVEDEAQRNSDYSQVDIEAQDIGEFFDKIENISVRDRATAKPLFPTKKANPLSRRDSILPVSVQENTKAEITEDLVGSLPIEKIYHTKRQQDIFIVKPSVRLSTNDYNRVSNSAKYKGGWYSRAWGNAPAGFAFETVEKAEAFAKEYPKVFKRKSSPEGVDGYNSTATESEQEEGSVRFRRIRDPELINRLDSEKKITAFRAMQLIDGKLYPPMSAIVDGVLRDPTEIGTWEQAVEQPELATADGYFKLNKGNKKTIKARYNPYFHTSLSPLNDQFSSAYYRPNLVTVEVEVPASELTSGYKSEKAKDAVGEMSWHSGPVSSKLPESKARRVILSRYSKVIRVVPDSEVAEHIAKLLEGENITIPENVITPSLKNELINRGVSVEETGDVRFRRGTSPREAAEKRYIRAAPSADTKARAMQAETEVAYAYNLTPTTVQQAQDAARGIYDNDRLTAQSDLLAGRQDKGDVNVDAQRMAVDKIAVDDLTVSAVSDPSDNNKVATAMLAIWRWYERGTDVARAMQLRFDPCNTPEGRRAWILRTILAPSKVEAEIIRKAQDTQEAITKLMVRAKLARSVLDMLKRKGKDVSTLTSAQLMDDVFVAQLLQDIAVTRSGWGDMVHEWWRNAILSAPTTNIVNAVGNAGHAALEAFVQRPVEALMNVIAKNPDAATFVSNNAMYKAIVPSLSNANKAFLQAWVTEKNVTGPGASKLEESDAAIKGQFGKIVRMPQRLMSATDEWFKTVFMAMLTADYATREFDKLVKEGKRIESDRDAYVSAQVSPKSGAYVKAWAETLRWSFQQKPGHMASSIMHWRNDPQFGFLLKFIFPFVKTPANIIATGIRKTPINALPYMYNLRKGNYKGGEAMRLGAEQAVGMVLMMSLYAMMKGDDDDELNRPRITGSRKSSAFSPKGAKESEMQNAPPMSIRVGDKWISYARLEPMATMVSTMVDALTAFDQAKDGKYADIPATVFSSIRGNLADKTFLQGVGNLVSIVEGDEFAMQKAVTSTLAGFNPNIIRSTARAFDPYIRDMKNRDKGPDYVKTVAERFGQTVMPAEANAPIPKMDRTGKPIEREGGGVYNAVVPFKVQDATKTTKIDAMVKRWNDMAEGVDRWWPSTPEPEKAKVGREEIAMNPGDYVEYQKVVGTIAQKMLANQSFNYDNPAERDILKLKKIYEEARKVGRERVRPQMIRRWKSEKTGLQK